MITNRNIECLGVIIARAGSKGLPGKNSLQVAGKPIVAWTIEHARSSRLITDIVLSTDSAEIAQVGKNWEIDVIMRPPELAHDNATVADTVRHAVKWREKETGRAYDTIVVLYGNVPIRPSDLADLAVEKLINTGADSVQSVCPVGKMHPYWMKTLGGPDGDTLMMYEENSVDRRQDLPPVYVLDGGVIALTRKSLFVEVPGQPHSFFGSERRAIVTRPGEVVDIDTEQDLRLAEVLLNR